MVYLGVPSDYALQVPSERVYDAQPVPSPRREMVVLGGLGAELYTVRFQKVRECLGLELVVAHHVHDRLAVILHQPA